MVDLNRSGTLTHAVQPIIVNDLDAINEQARTIIAVGEQSPDPSGWEDDLAFKHRSDVIRESGTRKNTVGGWKIDLRQHFGGDWHQRSKVRQFTQRIQVVVLDLYPRQRVGQFNHHGAFSDQPEDRLHLVTKRIDPGA